MADNEEQNAPAEAEAQPEASKPTTDTAPQEAQENASPAKVQDVPKTSSKSDLGAASSEQVAPPVYPLEQAVSYDNPAADPRRMRRIIAEDPEWTLATVPLLSELTMENIITNFPQNPILKDVEKKTPPLPGKYQAQILNKLSTEVPLEITANLIDAEDYWKRCCQAKWPVCDVSQYGGSWKRLFFERQLQQMVEAFIPGTTDVMILKKYLALVGRYIVRMDIRQLLPPIREPTKDDDNMSDAGSDVGEVIENDSHFDFNEIFGMLPSIQEFSVVYGVTGCLLNFEWNLFLFTTTDCLNLSKCVQQCKQLKKFSLQRSKVDDDKVRVLIKHILHHPGLEELDLSFNKIGDKGARALGKLINESKIKSLNLLDNQIGPNGMAPIAHALKKPTQLKKLNLRLNKLRDEGAQSLCVALLDNATVEELNIAANDITEQTSQFIAQLIVTNQTLCEIDLSCNQLGTDGGKQIQEAMESNKQITKLDLKLTSCGQESEYCINKMLDRNLQEKMQVEEDRFLSYYKPPAAPPPSRALSKPRTRASKRRTDANTTTNTTNNSVKVN